MVKLNIKKFSRSKVEEDPQTEQVSEHQVATITEPETSKKRGRPKKIQSQEIEIIKEVNEDKEVFESDIETADIETVDNEFLSELNNENYLIDDTDSEKQSLNESKSMMKNLLKNKKPKPVKQVKVISKEDDNDSLFGEDATPILGKDKRVLIAKVHQYKNLFPTELKKFKIKPNSSVDHLKDALAEMECIVETSSIDSFMTESILQSIKLIETGSSRTKYNISGTADLLKANPQFHNLIKQLYVKYNIFSKVPAEFQLVLLVGTTAMLCKNKNDKKAQLNCFLNEPLQQQQNINL